MNAIHRRKLVDLQACNRREIPRPSSRETASPPHLGERPRERIAATVCMNAVERPLHAEWAEAGPGRESSAENIGPKPEVGKRKRTDRPTR